MEGEVEICKKSCISSTNWTVSNGSLDDSISFETPISSINEDFHDLKSLKHPSVVLTSSSDTTPCEIKLSFEQKHEIRQVYVRSSARIYEIYYETGAESSNEYLCTVRCGIATKEDAPLGTNETSFEHVEGSIARNELVEDKVKSDSSSNTDEDGWVEVKVPDRNMVLTEGRIQEFYEATAEINDSSPCSSVTLRLLSLHTKGCVHLEEIYVYGEPIEPSDSDDKNTDPKKRSKESSIMAMLVPTLLQLSKTGMSKSTQDKRSSDVRQESLVPYPGRTVQEEGQSSLPNQEEVTVEAASEGNKNSDESVPGTGQRPDSVNHVNDGMERVLGELVSRVGRIEAFCSRFEEKMLKPICNIEARLERLEQQLEVLSGSGSHPSPNKSCPCIRIVAPDFSIIEESETNSLPNDGDENKETTNTTAESEFESESNPPGLVIRVPEFSNEQDEEGDDGHFGEDDQGLIIRAPEFSSEQEEEGDNGHFEEIGEQGSCNEVASPVNKPSLSIDDALSMALAGFISSSSSSSQPPQINHSWVVKAPDYTDSSASPFHNSTHFGLSSCDEVGPTTPDDGIQVASDDSTETLITGGFTRVWRGMVYDSDPDISLGNGEDVMRPPQVANPESSNKRDEVETICGQNCNLTVDFELPVLDVKFVSDGDLSTSGCSLQTLLGGDLLLEDGVESDPPLEVPLVDNLPLIINTDIPVIEIPDSPKPQQYECVN